MVRLGVFNKVYTMRNKGIICSVLFATFLISCGPDKPKEVKNVEVPPVVETPKTPVITYSLVNTFPHNINSFTEGFLVNDGKLFESPDAPEN